METEKSNELIEYLVSVMLDASVERNPDFDELIIKYMTTHALEILFVWDTRNKSLLDDGIIEVVDED